MPTEKNSNNINTSSISNAEEQDKNKLSRLVLYAPTRQMHAHLQSNSNLANERANAWTKDLCVHWIIMRTLIHYGSAHHLNLNCFNFSMKLELQTADYMNATLFVHLKIHS